MPVESLCRDNFYSNIFLKAEPALVVFHSPRCSYCGKFYPILGELDEWLAGSRRIYKINIDEEKELAAYYRVRSVPTSVLMKKGMAAVTCLGCLTKEQLSQMWDIAAASA